MTNSKVVPTVHKEIFYIVGEKVCLQETETLPAETPLNRELLACQFRHPEAVKFIEIGPDTSFASCQHPERHGKTTLEYCPPMKKALLRYSDGS